jgi:8-oxo-dGTP diphosphatase
MMSQKTIQVAVGVIYSNEQFFLTKRLDHVHQGGKWEFPGGKVETDETIGQALQRELKEEINIDILACQPLLTIDHDYGDKHVCLSVFLVDNFLGEPSAQEGQKEGWFSLSELEKLDFPHANKTTIEKLKQMFNS